ncbi:MAG: carbamoyltransferase HypF [Atopobiaceae bacterium]|nr:carbamoyltransferase HypF [Atopobiaceae bacterium]
MSTDSLTKRIRVYGIVQGVGFRPTVDRHATTAGIRGTVCNKGPYVEIFAQGSEGQIDRFVDLMNTRPPRRASILKIDVKPAEDAPTYEGFKIVESERTKGEIFISPDLAICEDCQRELYDPSDRRYLHPFINCTNCGPRMTILDALPYDRERTSMRVFPMCPTCAEEYYSPASRRYDAQPVCCNDCGPTVYLLDRPERGRAAITEARRILASGGVVAVKGIGGFHLACDATDPVAVNLLRERKRRSAKPFAVMARDLAVARRECEVSEAAEEILTGHQKPILLLPRRSGARVCEACAPENPKLGIMLPYAPLQMLLFDYDDGLQMPDCLVMTSANESGAPICRDDDDARSQLGPLCDAILSHDRIIRMRADDTVMDLYEDRPYMVRRSRGWAPLPFVVTGGLGTRVLAVGGELKNSFCLGSGELVYPSPYVGDLSDVRTVHACEDAIERFETLLEFEPDVIACDLHPRYNSTVVAEELAAKRGLPIVRVQHHYAHVAACMAENDVADRVIGVSFDGTGYGDDGTVWGGEILLSDYDGYERVGAISSFAQVGGDVSSREGWRIAVAMLWEQTGRDKGLTLDLVERLGLCDRADAQVILAMAERGVNTATSTSCGRLFDAACAVLGIRRVSTFEGEAATQLQFAAERYAAGERERVVARGREPGLLPGDGRFVLDTQAIFGELVERRLAGETAESLAYLFHQRLAGLVVAACERVRTEHGVSVVALTGGCYQNTLLLDLSVRGLRQLGFTVLTHHLVPPNDGGIALGQALVAAHRALGTGPNARPRA